MKVQLTDTQTAQGGNLTQENLDLVQNTVVAQCDELDGVKDGLIENPTICDFDITTLACSPGQNSSTCLSAIQLDAVQRIYAGPHDVRTNASLYPGMGLSSEASWTYLLTNTPEQFSIPLLQNLIMNNLSYDATTFNWGSDVDLSDEKAGLLIDEISANLTAFSARGGKLIVTQGWADPLNAAMWPIEQLQQIEEFYGGDVSDWFEVFMVPGGGHCGEGSYPQAPTKYHTLEELLPWVEQGVKPLEMLSSEPTDGTNTTRKLCPWPNTALYVGGDAGNWTSYVCG